MKNLCPVLCFILFFAMGCTSVKFYSDSELTTPTGFKYYTQKPFLQVERDPATGNIVKATVIYLPDLTEPHYIELRDGAGSSKLSIAVDNGSIKTLSYSSVPKIPESMEAMASLITKSADAAKDLALLKSNVPGAVASTITELYEFVMKPEGTTLKKIELK